MVKLNPTFDITALRYAAIAADLEARIEAGKASGFAPNRGGQDVQSCLTAMGKYGGWWGPWVDV